MERSKWQLVAGMVISVLGASLFTVLLWRVWDPPIVGGLCLVLLYLGTWLVDGFRKHRLRLRDWIIVGVAFVAGQLLSRGPSIFYTAITWFWAGLICWMAWKQLTPPKPRPPDGLSPDLTHQ